ncbi:uncharacterized protein At3g27210-like [Wolffia australiana]
MGSCLSSRKATAPLPASEKIENDNGEIFFDSRPWLDSDCESDFFSIRGDFTPSFSSSPDLQVAMQSSPLVESLPDGQSPRKKLGEFFHNK